MSADAHEPIRGFPDAALGAVTHIEPEHGRWTVYMDVTFWDTGDAAEPLQTERRRIADYATRQQAEVAARWMERGADRELRRPPSGL